MTTSIQPGDRVLIMQARHMPALKNRLPRYGKVTKVNGGYIYVRPSWCDWETECYSNELVLAPRGKPLPLTALMEAEGGSCRPSPRSRPGLCVGFM